MVTKKTVLESLSRCLIYSLTIILIDSIVIFALQGGLTQIIDSISFIVLLEGGIGLTVGGAVASYSPIGAKMGELLFHSKPWNAKRRKETERQARTWILTGIILICAALLLSFAGTA
jgi:hypothetical protein